MPYFNSILIASPVNKVLSHGAVQATDAAVSFNVALFLTDTEFFKYVFTQLGYWTVR